MNKTHFKKEGVRGLLYLMFFIAVQYYTPAIIHSSFFLILLVFIYQSKNDEFWIPLLMIMLSAPGYLFYSRGVYHLPVIGLNAEKGIKYNELVIIVLLLKSFKNYFKISFFYKKGIFYIFLYTFILWFIGIYYGMSFMKIFFTIRYLLPFSLFWSVPALINTREKIYKSLNLIFIFALFSFAMQLIDLIAGNPLSGFLGESKIIESFTSREVDLNNTKIFNVNQETVRTIYSVFILTIAFLSSAYLLLINSKVFNRKYLSVVLILTLLSVFLSATRGWIIAYVLVLFGMYIIKPKQIKYFWVGLMLITILYIFIPSVRFQVSNVFERLTTLESLAKGDVSANGTLSRLSVRGPKVMKKYAESPVLGFGYSMDYYEYADGHVGNQNLLLNSGVVGLSIYLIFLIYSIYYIYQKGKLVNKSLWIWIFGLLALLIIHSSSRQIFAYYFDFNTAIGLSSIFYLVDFFTKEQILINQKQTSSINNNKE